MIEIIGLMKKIASQSKESELIIRHFYFVKKYFQRL
eukprot:UN14208